jgi:hypothetical protein
MCAGKCEDFTSLCPVYDSGCSMALVDVMEPRYAIRLPLGALFFSASTSVRLLAGSSSFCVISPVYILASSLFYKRVHPLTLFSPPRPSTSAEFHRSLAYTQLPADYVSSAVSVPLQVPSKHQLTNSTEKSIILQWVAKNLESNRWRPKLQTRPR